MAEKLEACPFCGSQAFGWARPDGDTAVECRECGTLGPVEDSDHDALAAWNHRATPDRSDDALAEERVFKLGDRVEKISGSSWCGKVVGTYATSLTPEGYAVESEREPGSVQIYPAKALRAALKGDGL